MKAVFIGVVIVAIVVAVILWVAGVFSSPATSVIPIASTTPMPSPISLITLTPISTPIITVPPATTSVSTPAVTLPPMSTPSPIIVATHSPPPTVMAGGEGGGGGGGSAPVITPAPTPSPTPRLLASPVRDLPSTVEQGQSFDVIIEFAAPYSEFNSIGIADTVPDGWVVQLKNISCNPVVETERLNGNTVEYTWGSSYNARTQFTAIYTVTIPAGMPLGEYTFSGNLYYFIEEEGIIAEPIAGEQHIYIGE